MQVVRAMLFMVSLVMRLGAQDHKSMSVCEVISKLESLHGQQVVIRGQMVWDVDQWLRGYECSVSLRIKEVSFDPMLSVIWPGGRYIEDTLRSEGLDPRRAQFPLDQRGRAMLSSASSRFSRDEVARVYVELKGLLVTRKPLSKLVSRKFPKSPIGFGHLGLAPGMVIVEKVLRVEHARP